MTGPEHYREAERLLALAASTNDPDLASGCRQLAQVHADLAGVAVSALRLVLSRYPADHSANTAEWADTVGWVDVYGGGS